MSSKQLSLRTQRRIRLNVAKQQSQSILSVRSRANLEHEMNATPLKRLKLSTESSEQLTDSDMACTGLSSDESYIPSDDESHSICFDNSYCSNESFLTSAAEGCTTSSESESDEESLHHYLESTQTDISKCPTDLLAQSLTSHARDKDSTPLYTGSLITEHKFDVAMLSLTQRHNLTYSCQRDILRFVSALLPSPNPVAMTSKALIGRYINYQSQAKVHHCCGVCLSLLPEGERCLRQECVSLDLPTAMFVEIALDKQLKERFQGNVHIYTI